MGASTGVVQGATVDTTATAQAEVDCMAGSEGTLVMRAPTMSRKISAGATASTGSARDTATPGRGRRAGDGTVHPVARRDTGDPAAARNSVPEAVDADILYG